MGALPAETLIDIDALDKFGIVARLESFSSSDLWRLLCDHLNDRIQSDLVRLHPARADKWNDSRKRLLSAALDDFRQNEFANAKTRFLEIIEFDNLCEAGFLGLSLSHLALANFSLARGLCGQAAVLNDALVNGAQAELYRRFAGAIGPLESEFGQALEELRQRNVEIAKKAEEERRRSTVDYTYYDQLPDPAPKKDWDYWPLASICYYGTLVDDVAEFAPGPRNRHGYRSDPFESRRDLNVMSVGCSWTEGYGVAVHETWPARLCGILSERYNVKTSNWNLGKSGKSNDYIARMVLTATPLLKPDLVCVVFTAIERREYLTEKGRCLNFSRHALEAMLRDEWADPDVDEEVIAAFRTIVNPWDNLNNFLKNYHQVSSVLQALNIPWGFSFLGVSPGLQEYALTLLKANRLDPRQYFGSPLSCIDFAGGRHPDVQSHIEFARLIADWIDARYPHHGFGGSTALRYMRKLTNGFGQKKNRRKQLAAPPSGSDSLYPLY